MNTMASQITSVSIVYLSVCSCPDQIKHQSSASLAFVRGIHRWPVNSAHKGPAVRKMFPYDDVIMYYKSFTSKFISPWVNGLSLLRITMMSHGSHIVSNYQICDCLFNSFGQTDNSKQNKASYNWPFVMGINQWQRAHNVENVPMCRDVIRKMIMEMLQYKDAIFRQYRKCHWGNRTISKMGFPILVKWHLDIKSRPWFLVLLNLGTLYDVRPSGEVPIWLRRTSSRRPARWVSARRNCTPRTGLLITEIIALGPFYLQGLTLIPTWISNCVSCKVWDEIIYPYLPLKFGNG